MGQEESSHLKLPSTPEIPLSKSLFDFLYIIGRGGFGKVWKVRYKKTHKKYALKEMSKVKIIDRKSEKSIKNEKEFLSELHHPFLVNMICSFQDNDNLYLVMDLFTGGDLRYHICHKRKFSENETKFFIACVIIGLEYIHSKNIIHRDIKPENLVLDSNGYVAITDFGVAKKNSKDNSSETSGTPGYMSPEVLCAQNHSFPVDFFALGVMGFEFMNGYRPYLGRSRKEIKEAVLSRQARIHRKDALDAGWSLESCDFINRMIYRKPKKRLGFKGIDEIKTHQWFYGFSWEELKEKKIKSFFVPKNGDNFDRKYCEGVEKIDSETRRRYLYYMSKERYKDLFANYTFVKKELLNENGKISLKGFYVNQSNRNTTSSSKSSGTYFLYGNNNNNIFSGNNIIDKQNESGNNINNISNNKNNSKIIDNDKYEKYEKQYEKTPNRNSGYSYPSTNLMKYLGNNVSHHSNIKNNNNNSNNNSNSQQSMRHNPSMSAMPVGYNKYTSLNFDRNNLSNNNRNNYNNNNNNNEKLIYSPPHNIHHSSLRYENNHKKKEFLSKTMHQNESLNISNKSKVPTTSNTKPVSRMNLNLNNNYISNISNYKNNLNNRRSLYQFPNNNSNLSHTNFRDYSNNASKSKLYFHSNNNIENKEIKSSRYNRGGSIEKSISNGPILSKTSSMKLLNFNSSYLNNINTNQDDGIYKMNYPNYRNRSNRILSAGHYHYEKDNSNYIISQRTKHASGNNSIYKKHSSSDFNQIHHHF